MKIRLSAVALALGLAAALAAPASAANKEHQQLMADIRMLQEQSQQLQNLIAQLGDTLKAVNARLDDQTNVNRKAFADQKLIIDTLSSDLRVVREKVDDNNVRIGSLTQEMESVRQTVQQMNAPRPTTTGDTTAPAAGAAGAPPDATSPGTTPPPAAAPSGAAALGTSPQRAWDTAFSDYTAGQYDLAVLGFDAYIRDFPKSDMADNAQVLIGKSLMLDNKYDTAVDAFNKAIRAYPAGDAIPEAYYQKGLSLQHLGQTDAARDAFQFVVRTWPNSEVATLAKQKLDQLKKP
jgi:tol-pal system protein YbgF